MCHSMLTTPTGPSLRLVSSLSGTDTGASTCTCAHPDAREHKKPRTVAAVKFGNISGAGFIHDPPLTPRDTVVARAKLAGVQPRFVWMDDCVGYLLTSLDELHLSNSTLLVFAADHGSRYKGSIYRAGAVQVPMLMRWPARIAAGARVSELVSTVDLVPTWLELAGVNLSTSVSLDGYSIAPLLLGARHFAPRKDVYVEMGVSRAIHTKLWTLVVQRPSSTMLRQAAANVHKQWYWA